MDLLLVETIFDTQVAKAAFFAIQQYFDEGGRVVPLMCSVTIAANDLRTLSGQTLEAFWNSISHVPLLSVGLNCGLAPQSLRGSVEELSALAPVYTSAYLNAGLPNPLSETGYDETPDDMAPIFAEFARNGWINIAGGCCGTTPPHIAAIAAAVRGVAPRVPAAPPAYTRLSGLEAFTIRPETNFVNVGERTNVAGSPKFAKLIKEAQYEEALGVARQQVESGAQIIDINMDEGHAGRRPGHDHVPQSGRLRAGRGPRPHHDGQFQVGDFGSRAELYAGQERRQLHQPEGRRGGVQGAGAVSFGATGPPPSSWPLTNRARPTRWNGASKSAPAPTTS